MKDPPGKIWNFHASVVFLLLLVSCERMSERISEEKTELSPSILESEAAMDSRLDEFVRRVREKMEEIDGSSGQRAAELQTDLSAYIAGQTQDLMNQGLPITEIQDALRAAADRVAQTYAPDKDEFDEETDELLEPPVNAFIFFLPLEEAVITAFAAGSLDGPGLMEHIRGSADIVSLEMTEALELVLGDFGKNQALRDVITGGEIVAGSGGEAFMPESLTLEEADGDQYSVSDPAVFKTSKEVQTIAVLLESFDQKTFFKKADIKKLLTSGWLDDYDPRSVKKEAAYIIDELWKEFTALRGVYRRALEQRKGMLMFAGYRGGETEDFEDDL
jgi:hypothetical protein